MAQTDFRGKCETSRCRLSGGQRHLRRAHRRAVRDRRSVGESMAPARKLGLARLPTPPTMPSRRSRRPKARAHSRSARCAPCTRGGLSSEYREDRTERVHSEFPANCRQVTGIAQSHEGAEHDRSVSLQPTHIRAARQLCTCRAVWNFNGLGSSVTLPWSSRGIPTNSASI